MRERCSEAIRDKNQTENRHSSSMCVRRNSNTPSQYLKKKHSNTRQREHTTNEPGSLDLIEAKVKRTCYENETELVIKHILDEVAVING